MLNRIRRTVTRIGERYRHKGRHRRPATPLRPLAVPPGVAYGVSLFPRQRSEHTDVLMGEETALVRPYVLASEERARHRSTAVPCPPFVGPWFASAGDR
ncbi:hypothetical protein SHIRM173S_03414 [Streptomyces hirsutus]